VEIASRGNRRFLVIQLLFSLPSWVITETWANIKEADSRVGTGRDRKAAAKPAIFLAVRSGENDTSILGG
jgi:hypothetical protein